MGNHAAGKAMGNAARMWWIGWDRLQREPTQQEAMAALDEICRPWEHCDAEFEVEDQEHPGYLYTNTMMNPEVQSAS